MTAPTILDTARAAGADLPPRWEATLRAFYSLPLREQDIELLAASTRRSRSALRRLAAERPRFTELWCRVGRRGRKSLVAALIAVHEAAFGGHERFILPGEPGLIAAISKDAAGSSLIARFAEIHAQALGFETRWTSIGSIRVLEIVGVPFGIAVFPCSAKAPRGYAIPIIVLDEAAFFAIDEAEYLNSLPAVLGATRPAMTQFADARLIVISSPFGREGLFHDSVENNLGDDAEPGILAVWGPTWEWNPEVTEERTRAIEKDPRKHAQEFGAEPSDTVFTAIDSADVNASFARPLTGQRRHGFVAIDASSLRGDGFTFIGGYDTTHDELAVVEVGGWEGEELRRVSMQTIVQRIAERCAHWGTRTVFGDQREEAALAALFRQQGIELKAYAWSEQSKDASVQHLRRMMREREISICEHATMRRELLGMKARLMPSGRIRYETGGLDYASAVITLMHAVVEGEILGEAPAGLLIIRRDEDARTRVIQRERRSRATRHGKRTHDFE